MSKETSYFYTLKGSDKRYPFETSAEGADLIWLAEEAAEDYWHNQEGKEHQPSLWPLQFEIFDSAEKSVGECMIDLEPSFIAETLEEFSEE